MTYRPDSNELQLLTSIFYGHNIFQADGSINQEKVDTLMSSWEEKLESEPEYIRPLVILVWIKFNDYSLTNQPKLLCQDIMNKLDPNQNVWAKNKPNNADTISQYITDETKSFVETFTLFSTQELEFYGY